MTHDLKYQQDFIDRMNIIRLDLHFSDMHEDLSDIYGQPYLDLSDFITDSARAIEFYNREALRMSNNFEEKYDSL